MNMSHFQCWRAVRSLFLVGVGSALLASCSNLGYSSGSESESQTAQTADPAALAAEFNFPLTSCGEQATEPRGTWYVVYIDGANPDEVRREYCRDAIGTVRDGTGAPTVQVASLTDYGKALKLATAVGGEVETTVVDRTSPSSTGVNGSTSAQTNPSASTDMASLTATDPGSLINIRERASTSAGIRQTGRAGEQVRISEQQQGEDGRTWYKVVLESGTEGWVRSDFVSRQTAANGTGTTSTASSTSSSFNTNANSSPSSNSSSTSSDLRYPTGAVTDNGNRNSSSSYSADSYSSASRAEETNRYAASDRSSTSVQETTTSYSTDADLESDRSSTEDEYAAEASIGAGSYATLRSENPGARINVRNDASTAADIQDIGFAGDSVQVIDTVEGEDGYLWYQVELETGAVGWVRGDLLNGV
ncbi:SH3 domain-containing protein [Thermocoleostomius sinensis]|jgi:uncharacterized protein YgiM (DUF1202 family)|uniref:SH3 domain-containing protein n=1 Tax=Thermocoleostomius sinensis A174 TaxID=2016057 RepID=A0A9E9CC81_9CYAN|nr:SH3 domain-containing protein [Thermocoleostomius sinensis]WAL62240.1 SH3 domain-containing protein [Thermocoleostomius sinensis A174]